MFRRIVFIKSCQKVDASILITANVPSAKKIVIHHDADGDDDGTYEKFEINVNDPEGAENDSIKGAKLFREILKPI